MRLLFASVTFLYASHFRQHDLKLISFILQNFVSVTWVCHDISLLLSH